MFEKPRYEYATIHQFKSNIARYLRALEAQRYDAVIVKRRDEPVGMFLSLEVQKSKRARGSTGSGVIKSEG